VRRQYGDVMALDGVSFEVAEGEFFGLLGPNGAGKTTLMSILSGLSDPGAGSVRLDGRPLVRNDRETRRLLGLVPQELAIYDQLTARENLKFFGELFGCRGSAQRKWVEQLLAAVGLESRADDRAATYSGGMKRRLNLAVALVHRPRLLLLDEPTVGVDPQSRNLIFEEVRRLNADGMTIVYTSHYMEEVEALCRRIGIMDHGRLLACDTLPDLLCRLRGAVRFRIDSTRPFLSERLARLPDCHLRETGETGELELECNDVRATLLRLVSLLSEENTELLHLETREPSLERVFLHLTGHALRD
ncbi:MAG: ABC transporter ATP-binding protein, partial [Gemmataceae bacterium]